MAQCPEARGCAPEAAGGDVRAGLAAPRRQGRHRRSPVLAVALGLCCLFAFCLIAMSYQANAAESRRLVNVHLGNVTERHLELARTEKAKLVSRGLARMSQRREGLPRRVMHPNKPVQGAFWIKGRGEG